MRKKYLILRIFLNYLYNLRMSFPIIRFLKSLVIDLPSPFKISYLWGVW